MCKNLLNFTCLTMKFHNCHKTTLNSPVLLLIENCRVARGYEMSRKSLHSHRQIALCNELTKSPPAEQSFQCHIFLWSPLCRHGPTLTLFITRLKGFSPRSREVDWRKTRNFRNFRFLRIYEKIWSFRNYKIARRR